MRERNHRKGQQAKQAEKLAQKGMMQEKHAAYVSFTQQRHPVDSADLTERKTHHRNGITLKRTLAGGRYSEQVSRPQALENRIA